MLPDLAALDAQIAQSQTPQDRLQALLSAFEALLLAQAEHERQRDYAEAAYELAESLGDPQWLLHTSRALLRWHHYHANYAQAIEWARRTRELALTLGDKLSHFESLRVMSNVQFMIGDLGASMEILKEAYQLTEQADMLYPRGAVLVNMGAVYIRLSDWPQALELSLLALETLRAHQHPPRQIINILENLSYIYRHMGDGQAAKHYAQEAIAVAQADDLPPTNSSWMMLGQAEQLLGQMEAAEQHILRAAEQREGMSGGFWQGYVQRSLGDLYLAQGRDELAESCFQRGLDLFAELGAHADLADTHERLYGLYKARGDLVRALEHHEALYAANRLLHDERTATRIRTLQTLHDLDTLRQQRKAEAERSAALQRELEERQIIEAALRESEQRFRTVTELVSHFAYGYHVLPDGHLRRDWVAGRFEELMGYALEDLDHTQRWSAMIYPPDWGQAAARMAALRRGETVITELRIISATREVRWLRDYARPVWDETEGRLVYILGAAQDITDSKLAAQRAQELAVEREKVGLLATFLHDTSHDLRTPISIIKLSAHLAGRLDNETRRLAMLERIDQQADRLTQIISALHLMAQIDSGLNLTLQPVNLNDMIRALAESRRTQAQGRGLTLDLDLDPQLPTINADVAYLRQALDALLTNALQYTQAGSVRLCSAGYGRAVSICVEDSGIGISEEDQTRVFERFYKVNKARTGDGSGPGPGPDCGTPDYSGPSWPH